VRPARAAAVPAAPAPCDATSPVRAVSATTGSPQATALVHSAEPTRAPSCGRSRATGTRRASCALPRSSSNGCPLPPAAPARARR
jgi:hypothetical protein